MDRGLIGRVVLLALLGAARLEAQEPSPAWTAHRELANVASWATVGTSMALDTVHAWRQPDRGRALRRELLRVGLTELSVQAIKRLAHRRRPDGSDTLSFPSGHTAHAFASSTWNVSVSFPLALSSAYLRAAAAKHYPSDVGAGAAIGVLWRTVWRD